MPMTKSKGIGISDEDFDRLYSYKLKFKDCTGCKECEITKRILARQHYIYLYPGEMEYREKYGLQPVFDRNNFVEVEGEKLYSCTGYCEKCEESSLSCKLCPINIFARSGEIPFSEMTCKMKSVDMDWLQEVMKAIVDLYLIVKVGEM
jgi:hypothetical protein